MQDTIGDETLRFHSYWIDSYGAPYDPAEVSATVMRVSLNPVYGAFTYTGGDIINSAPGSFYVDVYIEDYLTPGNYSVKWEAEVEGTPQVKWEEFRIIDPIPEPSDILDPPRLYGRIIESNLYGVLGIGETDNLFLIGHADGIDINSPYHVINIKEAFNIIGGDLRCPLVRALLEAYNAGARDIWLVASAPMSEYVQWDPNNPDADRFVSRDEWGGLNFYERYAERLDTTYDVLVDWEAVDLMVPVEAPFYDTGGVDFFTPMVFNCFDRFQRTGYVSIGIMGTLIGQISTEDIDYMKTTAHFDELHNMDLYFSFMYDQRGLDFADEAMENVVHKFGLVLLGEAAMTFPQVPVTYTNSIASLAAGKLSATPFNYGLTYARLPHAVKPLGKPLKKDQIIDLASNRINPLIQTTAGKKGEPYSCVLASDNLASPYGSDYWNVSLLRIVAKVVKEIKYLGNASLGSIRYAQFKRDVENMLKLFVGKNFIRDFTLNIYRSPLSEDRDQTVHVDISLTPFVGVRELYFQVKVTPGA